MDIVFFFWYLMHALSVDRTRVPCTAYPTSVDAPGDFQIWRDPLITSMSAPSASTVSVLR